MYCSNIVVVSINRQRSSYLKAYAEYEISNNLVFDPSKASDQAAHMGNLIRAFASRLIFSMSVKLLTAHHLRFLSFKGGCTGSSRSTLVKMPHCRKSHVEARIFFVVRNP